MIPSEKFAWLIIFSPALIIFFIGFNDLIDYFEFRLLLWSLFWFILINLLCYLLDFLFVSYMVMIVPVSLIALFTFISQIVSGEPNMPFGILLFIFLTYIIFKNGYDEKLSDEFNTFANFLEQKFKFLRDY